MRNNRTSMFPRRKYNHRGGCHPAEGAPIWLSQVRINPSYMYMSTYVRTGYVRVQLYAVRARAQLTTSNTRKIRSMIEPFGVGASAVTASVLGMIVVQIITMPGNTTLLQKFIKLNDDGRTGWDQC